MAVTIERRTMQDGTLSLTLAGKIDEHFDAAAIVAEARGKTLLHLAGVRSISSLGVRAFERLLSGLPGEVVLVHVSPAVAAQLVMIPSLVGGRVRVETAKLPFVCAACGAEKAHSVPFRAGAAGANAPTCSCGAVMELDGLPEQYLPAG